MRASVFTDARLLEQAGRFAWLEIDTEQPRNVPFVEKYPIDAWPTVYVLDPFADTVLLRWMGSATAAELAARLDEAAREFHRQATDALGATMARGAALAGARRHAEAAVAFREALDRGGPGWPGRAAAADTLLQALAAAGDRAGCAAAAAQLLPSLPRGPAFARVAATGLGCAGELEEEGARRAALAALAPDARTALAAAGATSDDRLGLYEGLLGAARAAGDEAGARRVAGEWLDFIEAESARAASPLARSALDGARLQAAVGLGQPQRALPALEASAAALPGESFAWSTLGAAYLEAGAPRKALPALRKALALAAGPRRVRVLLLEAKALLALGDGEGARSALRAAVAHGEGMPEAVRPRGPLAAARKLLGELSGGGAVK